MNDLKMGFKHTILQRLQNFEVCLAKATTTTTNPNELHQQPQQVTDFSISRILSENGSDPKSTKTFAHNPPPPQKSTILSAPPSATADILDLSKSANGHAAPHHPSLAAYPALSYYGLHADFLAAAAAANATKFYAQFFPHMFPTYLAASNLNLSTPPTSPYQKRYFAPYIINSSNGSNSAHARLPPATTPTKAAKPAATCPRTDCTDCFDYYKQFPYKSPAASSPHHTTYASGAKLNYLKAKPSSDVLVNSSNISLTTVNNLNLNTAKSAKPTSIVSSTTAANLNLEEISYKCRICDKVFGCSQTLQAHEKTHKSPRYECSDCGKGFSQLRNYKYHLSVHRGTKEFAAECPECGKTFNDKGYLSSHMKIHRNKKEYECPYCPKSFNQRVAFNMHVRIHTGVKPHKCVECGKRFSRKMLLKQHMRTHSGEKPYQCSVCGKSFADRSNMTLHHRLHSGIKPFNCPICPKAFTKKHHLKTHLNYHTGCKPYVCPHPNCNQAFTQSSNMRTHAKKCQYRPLQTLQPFPVVVPVATNAAGGTITPTAELMTATTSMSAALRNGATHIPMSSSTLTAGIRMLTACAAAPSAFPPAQQQLLSTLRPF